MGIVIRIPLRSIGPRCQRNRRIGLTSLAFRVSLVQAAGGSLQPLVYGRSRGAPCPALPASGELTFKLLAALRATPVLLAELSGGITP